MPLYVCAKCQCVENTATGGYWGQKYMNKISKPICSECDTGEWHNHFKQRKHDGIYNDNFVEYTDVFGYNTGKTATKEQIIEATCKQ